MMQGEAGRRPGTLSNLEPPMSTCPSAATRIHRTAVSRAAALVLVGQGAAWCALAQTPPPQTFTRTIDSLVEVRSGPPSFSLYSLPAGESLRITRDGELNAPLQSSGAAIGLAGRVLNEGKLRASFGTETMGLQVSGELTNAGGSLSAPAGLIETVSLSAISGARISNFGVMFTGSHTFPAGSTYPAGERVAFMDGGSPMGGFGIAAGARIDNEFLWRSQAHGAIYGELLNNGVFFSDHATATLPQAFGNNYFKTLDVMQDGTNAPGRILNQGQMLLDELTLVRNAGVVENAGQLGVAGQMEIQFRGQLYNRPGAQFNVGGKLTVTLGAAYDGVRNEGNLVFMHGGQLVNNNRVVNTLGAITVAAADPAGYEAGRVVQSDTGELDNSVGLLTVQGSFTGGVIENALGRVMVQAGGHLSVQQFSRGQIDNIGGHVEIGRNAFMGDVTFTQTSGRLTVNGALGAAMGSELQILGGVLDGGGVLDRLTGTVSGGGLINGNVFLSGRGGGLVQQPPYCRANGWACFRPGNSPGAMQINGDLTLGDNAVLQLEIERDASGQLQWDTVLATTMHFGAGSVIELVLGSNVGSTDALPLDLLRCDEGCTFEGTFNVLGGSGELFADAKGLHFSGVSAVPEPAPAALLAAGVLMLSLWRRRRDSGSGNERPA